MSVRLSELQKRLCNVLQEGLNVCARPFASVAEAVGSDEETVLREIEGLKKGGVIRRIGVMVSYRALGLTSTLVTGHVPQESLREVADAVSSLENVSHNYLRNHCYNLWFTLQGESEAEIERTLSRLSARFGVEFHSLPVEHVFKLDVRFDVENDEQPLLRDVEQIPVSEAVELNETEKQTLSKLEGQLELTAEPFGFLCDEGLDMEEVLRVVRGLIEKGVIRRIAAIVDHRKLGFTANVMFCSEVPPDRVVEAGKRLARFRVVSHCYERRTFEGWPYNLFAMMHGRSTGEVQHVVDKFVEGEGIDSFELLATEAEFKKRPVKHRF